MPRGRGSYLEAPFSVLGALQGRAEGFALGDKRITCEAEAGERPFSGRLVSGAACVADDNRDETEIGAVAHSWLDPDLGCDPYDREGVQPAITQNDGKRRPLESGHRDLVEDRLART